MGVQFPSSLFIDEDVTQLVICSDPPCLIPAAITDSAGMPIAGSKVAVVANQLVPFVAPDGTAWLYARMPSGRVLSIASAPVSADDLVTTLTQYAPQVNVVATAGASQTLPSAQTVVASILTLDQASCALTLPAAVPGQSFLLQLVQGSGGSKAVTWGANVFWAAATAPTLSTAAGKRDVLSFACVDGTNWVGSTVALDAR